MKRNVKTATRNDPRPNRLLIALAAAWMILSLAIGGAIAADSSAERSGPTPITSTTTQT